MKRKTNEPPIENDTSKKKRRKHTCTLCGPTETTICRIPKCEHIRKQWIEFCEAVSSHRKPLNPETSRLCIVHFTEENILRNKAGIVTRLMPNAIPTIYKPDQIERLKDLTTDSVPDVAATIKKSFERIMQQTLKKNKISSEDVVNGQCDTLKLSLTPEKSKEGTGVSDKVVAENELRSDVNSNLEVEIVEVFTSTPTSTTPTISHSLPGNARFHSIRYLGDIRVTDLETPEGRNNCVKIIHHENKIMKNKIHALQRQTNRLRKKVQNLKDALKKFRREN